MARRPASSGRAVAAPVVVRASTAGVPPSSVTTVMELNSGTVSTNSRSVWVSSVGVERAVAEFQIVGHRQSGQASRFRTISPSTVRSNTRDCR